MGVLKSWGDLQVAHNKIVKTVKSVEDCLCQVWRAEQMEVKEPLPPVNWPQLFYEHNGVAAVSKSISPSHPHCMTLSLSDLQMTWPADWERGGTCFCVQLGWHDSHDQYRWGTLALDSAWALAAWAKGSDAALQLHIKTFPLHMCSNVTADDNVCIGPFSSAYLQPGAFLFVQSCH